MQYNEKALEEVLRGYPLLKAQAKVDQEELRLLFPSCTPNYDGMPHSTGVSDQTGDWAVKREKWTQNMKRARAIEIALEALTEQEGDFITYCYFKQWRPYQIGLRIGASKRTMFYVRRSALNKIAQIIL